MSCNQGLDGWTRSRGAIRVSLLEAARYESETDLIVTLLNRSYCNTLPIFRKLPLSSKGQIYHRSPPLQKGRGGLLLPNCQSAHQRIDTFHVLAISCLLYI